MMGRIAIVTDSTAGLSPQLVKELDISVIPLNIHWGEETYLDGVTLDAETFYRWLQERKEHPMTSQPSAGAFIEFFKTAADRYQTDTILGIFVSSALSGTFASAMLAKQSLPELNIELVDSRSLSMGLGFYVMAAVHMAQQGVTMEEILEHLQQMQSRMHILFAVDTLDYLHRGGRIGGAAHLLGTMLNLKPLLTIVDGRVESLEKVRSRRKSLKRMLEIVEERLQGRRPPELAVVHTGEQEDVDLLVDWINERLRPQQLYTGVLTPVVGTHGGPGTVAVVFYTEGEKYQ
ncbi:MAG: DegV family protein [Anaerolineae bacterium]|nr:DegV family protein [Anaerolineae bacterium]